MTGRCCWCGQESDDLVERPTGDDRTAPAWWCRESAACQAARAARQPARGTGRLRITQRV